MRGIRLSCMLLLGVLNIFCSSVIKETERIAAKHGAGAGDTQTSGTNTTPAPVGNITGTALWARSTSASPVTSPMSAVAVDSSGNVYAAGGQYGNGTYTYGGVNAIGFASAASKIMIVKYDASGTVQWVITNTAGTNGTRIYALAVDSAGNIYAAGSQTNTGNYDYSGQIAAGASTTTNAVIVKYSNTGTALWARTTSGGTAASQFLSIAAESGGGDRNKRFEFCRRRGGCEWQHVCRRNANRKRRLFVWHAAPHRPPVYLRIMP